MKRICLAAILTILAAIPVQAANFTVTYTAGQDTIIQTRIIPAANAAKCVGFGLPTNCISSDLVTKGCVAVALPAKNYFTCTIYAADATGEAAFLQDELNRILVDRFLQLALADNVPFKTFCLVASAAAKTNACTAVGAPTTCNPCP